MEKKVFIVDDEAEIVEPLSRILTQQGFSTMCFSNGENIPDYTERIKPDMILLDSSLPGISGFEVCRQIKLNPKTWNIPIIIYSSKNYELDILASLEIGVDDYLIKPISYNVLAAKIRGLIRKQDKKRDKLKTKVKFRNLEIDPDRHRVTVNRKEIVLTPSEFNVLYLLVSKPGIVFNRYQLIEKLRGFDHYVNDRSIDVLLNRLRKKLGLFGKNIETVYGIGYKFSEESLQPENLPA